MGRSQLLLRQISVVGLGKLGLCLAAVLASRGFKVTGVDVDGSRVTAVNRGICPIFEPGLARLMRSNRERLSATEDYDKGVVESDATFVVVPTPSEKSGGFSLVFVKHAMQRIGRALSRKKGYHLIVLTSTVMPGSMDDVVIPTIERSSRKICGKDFGVCYNPEFIALGDVIEGLLKPDLVLIGESDRTAGDLLAEIQSHVCINSPAVERINFRNAELAKIAVNSFVTMKMSFANTLAEICERFPDGDVDKVTRAIGKDRRIGPDYLKGAVGYGGPCFPRDNIAFARLASRVGVRAELALATHRINERQAKRIVKLIEAKGIHPPSRVGILGMTYKPNTNVLEASPSLALTESLTRKGFEVHVYDPTFKHDTASVLGPDIEVETNVSDCIRKSDLCVIATPWKMFSAIDKTQLSKTVVLDCWRILDDGNQNSQKYVALGRAQVSRKVTGA